MDFLQGDSVLIYFFIYFGKMLEVSCATLRVVLISRGERVKGSIIAILEIFLWVTITGTVLAGFTSNIYKVIVFCAAFASGVYFGSWLENKLAIGLSTMHIIAQKNEDIEEIVSVLRAQKIAVTVVDGEGKDGLKKILIIHIKRSRVSSAVKLVNSVSSDCVITVQDVRALKGGYIKK